MPKWAKSSCTSVAIFMRCVLEELVTMENSTALPDGSSIRPAPFHVNPADFSSCRDVSNERCGWGMAWLTQSLLPGPTLPQSAVPLVPYTNRTIESRSMAADTASRNFRSRNHACLRATASSFFELRSLRLKTRKLYSRLGPRSTSCEPLRDCSLDSRL